MLFLITGILITMPITQEFLMNLIKKSLALWLQVERQYLCLWIKQITIRI